MNSQGVSPSCVPVTSTHSGYPAGRTVENFTKVSLRQFDTFKNNTMKQVDFVPLFFSSPGI